MKATSKNYTDRLDKAISQVRTECECHWENIYPNRSNKYWLAVERAEKEFDVSGLRIDMIIQMEINTIEGEKSRNKFLNK